MTSRKILFLIPSLSKGGQERAGMILTNNLNKFHNVVVVALEPTNSFDFPYESKIIRIEIPRAKTKFGKVIVVLRRIIALRKIKKQENLAISIAFGDTAILLNSLSLSPEKKISSLRQSIFTTRQQLSTWEKLLCKLSPFYVSLILSDYIVPVNDMINNQLKDIYDITNDLFVYNGTPTDKILDQSKSAIPVEIETFFNGKVMAHLGRISLAKGQWHLIQFYVLAKKQMPALKLVLIGGIDTSDIQNQRIYDFCLNHLEENNIRFLIFDEYKTIDDIQKVDVLFLGHQSNPFKFLIKCDLFVFPSLWEGFPNALIEAMACGLPVISSNCLTGPKEVLINKETNESFGILIPPFVGSFQNTHSTNKELYIQWADEIINIFNDTEKSFFLKKQSLKRASEFSVEQSTSSWLSIIEQVT